MFDTSAFDFSFRPNLQLEDNAGRFWIEDDDGEMQEVSHPDLYPGMGVHDRERIHYHGEVEVAYIGIESTLSDVNWVTMHRDGDDYRLVFRTEIPDYDEDQLAEPQFHSVPTFGELVYAFDRFNYDVTGSLAPGWVQGTIMGVTFSSMGSEHYPQLGDWYFAVQDHFFMTGEMIYLDDPRGEKMRVETLAEPQPHRRAETEPGSGSFFAAPKKHPELFGQIFQPQENEEV